MHEIVASIKEYFHPSHPQLTEREALEIRNRLLDLAYHPAEPLQVEAASVAAEGLPNRRDQ
jgi:hypothetical protein